MSRVVIVSNRLPSAFTPGQTGEPEIPAGGLAAAIYAALRASPRRSLWFGWNGKVEGRQRSRQTTLQALPHADLVGMPLVQAEVDDYYHGFCNTVLWPLFHCFQDRVRVDLEQERRYRRTQVRFAETLLPQLETGDLIWVHDYHLLLLGRELRRLGWSGPIGFFLHVPFPPHDLWSLLPDPRGFLEALTEYDLAGFQVGSHLENYIAACRRQLEARWDGGVLAAGGRRQRAGTYPVSIDPRDFEPPPGARRLHPRRGVLARVVRGRRLILGADRLDYTKGIPERIQAYERFIRDHPEWRKKVSFIQIGAPSRPAALPYQEEKRKVEALVGRVNGELASHDWVPIRYLYRTYPRADLARFYREADVGLVTPLRDGMNLVAKEFVAAQYPESPGVLLLSRFAGAAEDLPEALLVNPHIPAEVGEALARALSMPLEERLERHRALLDRVRRHTVADWGRLFLRDLSESGEVSRSSPALPHPRPEIAVPPEK